VLENIRSLFKHILEGLNARQLLAEDDISAVESVVIASYIELVTKLNETAFRPLFRKLYDWAFSG